MLVADIADGRMAEQPLPGVNHRDSSFVPGTQHLALSAAVGFFLGAAGACLWLWLIRVYN